MAGHRTYYVVMLRRYTSGRWVTGVGTTTDRPQRDGTLIAAWEVGHVPNRDAAIGAVVEWLATGRPAAMSVTPIDV